MIFFWLKPFHYFSRLIPRAKITVCIFGLIASIHGIFLFGQPNQQTPTKTGNYDPSAYEVIRSAILSELKMDFDDPRLNITCLLVSTPTGGDCLNAVKLRNLELQFPNGYLTKKYHCLSGSKLKELMTEWLNWGPLYERYKANTIYILRFSNVVFQDDDNAFLYFSVMRGHLNGYGTIISLAKENGQWVVKSSERCWVS